MDEDLADVLESVDDRADDLAAARLEVEQLQEALASRLVIGQAQGIIMERLGTDADVAFSFLRRASSTNNRKLRDVAEDLVRTGQLPEMPGES